MNKDGSCNLEIVSGVLSQLNKKSRAVVVNKSTVPPGTTEQFNKYYKNIKIIYNPEFLTERNAVEDFKNQERIILGGSRPATTVMKQIYSTVFPKSYVVKTGSKHAEMIKYFTNCFLATKVSFANEMYQVCEKLNIDYDKVVEYATLDDRLGKSHWNVPGPDGDFGFGGHCLPKDLHALISLAHDLNVQPRILTAVDSKNNDVRTDKDWKRMKGRAVI
jgi:UDPglucose 6-dehydrogenase